MFKNKRVFAYILAETIPSFLLGVFIFISVLLMFQSLRLTEFLLVHGIKWTTLARIMGYMSISFLPMLLPMSLLFEVLTSGWLMAMGHFDRPVAPTAPATSTELVQTTPAQPVAVRGQS